MNCVIIEDELAGQEIIKYKLNQFFPQISILKIIDNKLEAIDFINNNEGNIDFIFLDIEIKGGSGLAILENVNHSQFETIFITAYENFAIEAFKIGAIHYLLKPFKDLDFINSIKRIQKNKITESSNKIEEAPKRITVNYKNEIFQIELNEILYLKSSGSYTEVKTPDKNYLSSKNLGDFEKTLDKSLFFRVHHSYLANLSKIVKIEKGRNGQIHLSNDEIIPISQRKLNDFLVLFNSKK